MKRKRLSGFTLAEVLITLAIIGVVAALSIPAVISNSQQQEFKTGLRKAVSVLNSAITMNMALDGESPYDNANLFGYLQKHMAVLRSFSRLKQQYYVKTSTDNCSWTNAAFYTTDGMRYEIHAGESGCIGKHPLHENSRISACLLPNAGSLNLSSNTICGGCGSYGLNSNFDNTTRPPCLITVDVNGDRKPNPENANCKKESCAKAYKYSDALGLKLTDLFSIIITDKQAIPYGVAAQRAMYQARK